MKKDYGEMMSRHQGQKLKVIIFVGVFVILLYGVYLYHDVHSKLIRSEERGDRMKQQHDSLAAQLQGL